MKSGKVAAAELKVEGGFLRGYYILDTSLGRGKVYFKNENIALWIEDKSVVLPSGPNNNDRRRWLPCAQ